MYLEHYLKELNYYNMPDFLLKYLKSPSLLRLKKVGYFCGMDYASSDIYNFREYISRFDHSLTVSLIVYNLTHDKKATLAGLFHDIATPCFSHVIDYMNKDYEKQESTEEYTEFILREDTYLKECLKKDGLSIDDIVNFKAYSIVDNDRPKVCADRIDGVILTGIGWTKNISKKDISYIVHDMDVFVNEDKEEEIGFKNLDVARKVIDVSNSIDVYCHSKEDNYMMELLASITRMSIDKKIIVYEDLYRYNEKELFDLLNKTEYVDIHNLVDKFKNIKLEDIPKLDMPKVKRRDLNPIVNGTRIK